MLIVADENIPYVREAFSHLGEVRTLAGRAIARADVADADALLVRSVTRVGEALLAGSRVRFVGTATAGIDHVDTKWLERAGVSFASAQGSNAESVAEYIAAALCVVRRKLGIELRGRTIGIVGVGHCGSRVERIARAIGMEPVLCDPPLARLTGDAKYRRIEELKSCDVLTIHTPLTLEGVDKTAGMIDGPFIVSMKPGAALMNAARGGIVDERALIVALESKRISAAVIDAWEGEPNISIDLMRRAEIATPHIAGYSLDGKIRGTEMIYHALCDFLGEHPAWCAADMAPETTATNAMNEINEDAIARAILSAYPIHRDDATLRKVESLPEGERGVYFDRLRRDYPVRREFRATRIVLTGTARESADALRRIGFTVADSGNAGGSPRRSRESDKV